VLVSAFPASSICKLECCASQANLPGWADYPVRAEIERRLGARVVLENDANVAALGEQWLGAARGVPNMAVVTLGTGIGGGIVLGGKIWHGMNGMSGEFGHVTLEPEGQPCGCGSHGLCRAIRLRQRDCSHGPRGDCQRCSAFTGQGFVFRS